MIRYALRCDAGHAFDSWFAGAEAFDTLARAGHVSCPSCGSTKVEKTLMAPAVRPGRRKADAPSEAETPPAASMPTPATPAPMPDPRPEARPDLAQLETMLANLRAHVEANSEYVGNSFASEARRIHEGDAPERLIHGQASPTEARELIEEGVPILPLPFRSKRSSN